MRTLLAALAAVLAVLASNHAVAAPVFQYQFDVISMQCRDERGGSVGPCEEWMERSATSFMEQATLAVTLDALVNQSATYSYQWIWFGQPAEVQNDGLAFLWGAWNQYPSHDPLACPDLCRATIDLDHLTFFLGGSFDLDNSSTNIHMSGDVLWSGTLRTDYIYVQPTFVYTGIWYLAHVVPEAPGALAFALLAFAAALGRRAFVRSR